MKQRRGPRTKGPARGKHEPGEIFAIMYDAACQYEYCRTKNPLFLMEAYRECRAAGRDVPKWILSYFDRVASGLLEEAERRRQGGTSEGARPGVFLQEIMGMKVGRGDPFNHYAEWTAKLSRAEAIAHELTAANPEISRSDLTLVVAEKLNETLPESEWVTFETVDKWFTRSKD